MLTLNKLIYDSTRIAKAHGFHSNDFPTRLMLIVSELAEALEEWRAGNDDIYHNSDKPDKPEGVAVELADAFIRLADLCGTFDLPVELAISLKQDYNETRPWKHGGKLV